MIPIPAIDFSNAEFTEVSFSFSIFENAYFFNSKFRKKADFWVTEFHKFADFRGAIFEDIANFTRIVLGDNAECKFYHTIFKDYLIFDNKDDPLGYDFSNALLNLQGAIMEKPERCGFHTLILHPSWFIDTDPRKFVFTNIQWKNIDSDWRNTNIKAELDRLDDTPNAKRLLTIACRQFAENAENNSRFEEASKFRRMAFETERLLRKEKQIEWWNEKIFCRQILTEIGEKLKNAPFDFAHFLYRTTSYYGESSARAFKLLMLIILLSAFLYWTPLSQFLDKENFRSLEFLEAVSYSLRVMVLQRPEPFPANTFGKWVVALESVLAPLQAALLALAIRRKFMR
jgi:hypothetical protein